MSPRVLRCSLPIPRLVRAACQVVLPRSWGCGGSPVFALQLLRPVYQEDAIPEGESGLCCCALRALERQRGQLRSPPLRSGASLTESGYPRMLTQTLFPLGAFPPSLDPHVLLSQSLPQEEERGPYQSI